MLSLIPTELQSDILSHLPRQDLVAVARLSHQLHAVAIRILYLKVELRTSTHLENFFLPSSPLFPLGTLVASDHSDSRRTSWEMIKDLTIDIKYSDRSPGFPIPDCLRNGNLIELEHLRVVYAGDPSVLLPLLACFNPNNLVFSHPSSSTGGILSFDALGGLWTRLREVTFAPSVAIGRAIKFVPSNSTPFLEVTTVNVSLSFFPWVELADDGGPTITFVLRLFPSLRRLDVVVETETRRARLEALFKGGFEGKEEGFFSVTVGKAQRFGINE